MKHWVPFLLLLFVALSGCKEAEEEGNRGLGFEDWYPRYNTYIKEWLAGEVETAEKALEEQTKALAEAETDEQKKQAQGKLDATNRLLERLRFRQSLGGYFKFADPSEVEELDLKWEDGSKEPEIGDPNSTKGGTFRFFLTSFPPTIRGFGTNSNNSFRGELYDNVEISLVDLHPETGGIIPGVAKEWAIGPDNKTVFFRLDPDATYSDGVPVKAKDFMIFLYLRASDNVVSPWFKQYIREEIAQVTVYTDDLLAVTLPDQRPKLPYYAAFPRPSPPHFYDEFGADFEDRYQWKAPPTTGAYTLYDKDLVKGASITLSRVENWWAKDKKFYRYRYNADRLSYRVVRDLNKAWELFRAGEIDYFPVTLPEYWYGKSEMPPVFNGYVERYTWYNQYPRVPWALYLNTAKEPLDNRDVRVGISHASNWQKVIDVVFRGDAERLPGWTVGYGDFDNPKISPRPFSVQLAREAFAKAGYTVEGEDGILRTADGKRLEVSVTYRNLPVRTRMMTILKEEAKKAGLDLILDGLDGTVAFKKSTNKEHQAAFTGWGFVPPYPRYYEYFHSNNAYDEQGNVKPNTNNMFSFKDDRMDELAVAYRSAKTEAEKIESAHEMQEIIHDAAVLVPGYMTEFARIATWRWVRWPDSEHTELAPPRVYIPMESYVYWIDEELQKETLADQRARHPKTFPEVEEIKERYRVVRKPKGKEGEE